MRTFIAAVLAPSCLEPLESFQKRLAQQFPGIRTLPHQNLHLTLAFLGDQPPATLEDTAELVLSVGGRTSQIRTSPQGLQILGRGARKRPLCLMLERDPELLRLQHHLGRGLNSVGVETEKRPFRPHLTLARVSPPLPPPAALEQVSPGQVAELRFERLVLFRSRLLPQGAQHIPLADVALAKTAAGG